MRIKVLPVVVFLLIFSLGCAPKSFMRTYGGQSNWKVVEVREDIQEEELWIKLVDTLSQKYDLQVIEKKSGYLRTAWAYTTVNALNNVNDRYRSRIIVKINESEPIRVNIKCESNWLGSAGWESGYDSILLEDVYGDIQGKIGRVRR